MTTAYDDATTSSQSVAALMQRVNALESGTSYVNLLDIDDISAGVGNVIPDNDGNLLVAAALSGNFGAVHVFTKSGTLLESFGSITPGDPDYISGAIGLYENPSGVVYVTSAAIPASPTAGQSEVLIFDSDHNYSARFGGQGTGNGEFGGCGYIAVDASGNLFITDRNNHRVQKFNSSGVYQAQFGSNGTGNGEFDRPIGIAIDGSGYIWVVDSGNDRIQKFDSSGTYVSQFGSNGTGEGELDNPNAIWIDGLGRLFVSDQDNDRVQVFDSSGGFIAEFGTSGSGTGQFDRPLGLSVDSDGYVYVIDQLNAKLRVWRNVPQSTFYGYTPTPVSLGTPDGGSSVPAGDALVTANSLMAAQIIEDIRDAIEALAPFYENVATGAPFNWTDASVNNLYFKAVDPSDYGDSGSQYDWWRTKAAMYDAIPEARDIGELDDCITLLELSDPV